MGENFVQFYPSNSLCITCKYNSFHTLTTRLKSSLCVCSQSCVYLRQWENPPFVLLSCVYPPIKCECLALEGSLTFWRWDFFMCVLIWNLKGKANSEAKDFFPLKYFCCYLVFQHLLLLSIFQFIKHEGSSFPLFTGWVIALQAWRKLHYALMWPPYVLNRGHIMDNC